MNIQAMRIMARNCWDLASKFQKHSPAAQKLLGAMGHVNYEMPKNLLGRWLVAMMKKVLRWRMDKLILIDDPSVRIMTLKAMSIAHYTSKHVGLIATLYASDEVGYTLDEKGKSMSSEEVSREVWRYLLGILEVPNYFDDLQQCINHWEGCLAIDYTKEFSVEDRWDFSGKEPVRIHRDVPPEEVAERIARNKLEVRELYKHDLNKLLEKQLSGYYEKRLREVYQCLDKIFAYLFQQNLDNELIGTTLGMMARIARMKHLPEKWLLELSQKYT
ncbi:MAG TPA: hypothetical protein DEA46_01925 [Candidatus Moranbacteria bacterium]|nr:hypothetical protein [Candidatus Moranbacteria bacterium]